MEVHSTVTRQFEAVYEKYTELGYRFETSDNSPNLFIIRRGSANYKYTDLLGMALFTAEDSFLKLYPVATRAAEYHARKGTIVDAKSLECGQYVGSHVAKKVEGVVSLSTCSGVESASISTMDVYSRSIAKSNAAEVAGIAFKYERDYEALMNMVSYCSDIVGGKSYNLTVFDNESSKRILQSS